MHTSEERALGALRALLRASHVGGPSGLPALVRTVGEQLGADDARLYLVDYEQSWLVPVSDALPREHDSDAVAIDGTVAGLVFSDIRQHASTTGGTTTLWTPVLSGTERLGVLALRLRDGEQADEQLCTDTMDVAALLAELVLTRSLYGDAVEKTRRRAGLSVAAELQWGLLPPLTFVSPEVSIAGVLAPATEVAGDSFDYAANGETMHVAIFDAMGHGLEATLLAAVALSILRNSRRSGLDLAGTVLAMDAGIAAHFGPDKFLTGIVGELHVPTGMWRWVTCGHPPALLLRAGQVVKTLDGVTGVPIGLSMFGGQAQVCQERLQPGDRLLLHTDGVTEARDADGEFFGTDRLESFLTREAADARPVAETLRRLNLAVMRHQHGRLQDDATVVILEWRTDELRRTTEGSVPLP